VSRSSVWGFLGAAFAFAGVAAGAFGAHALRNLLPADRLQLFETGARYQLIHAIALLALAVALERGASRGLVAAGWLFVAGQILFAGSLYALAWSGQRLWGAVTPLGGLCFLAGWVLVAAAFARR